MWNTFRWKVTLAYHFTKFENHVYSFCQQLEVRALDYCTYLNNVFRQPSRPKLVQSQQNNVRTTFTERCSNVILLTLNRFWLAENVPNKSKKSLWRSIGSSQKCFRLLFSLISNTGKDNWD